MKTNLAGPIRAIQTRPDGWLHVEVIRKVGTGVVISLALREGKGGPWVCGWEVRCRGVREISVSDLERRRHWTLSLQSPRRQAVRDEVGPAACRPDGKGSAILGALAAAHAATVDDWIPVDRYLPMEVGPNADFVVRAPDFLVRAYAKALDRLGVPVRVTAIARKRRTNPRPSVLHLGNSFVVADRFEATLGAKRLENNQMQRTAPAQAKVRRR